MTMDRRSLEALIRGYYAAFNARDLDRASSFFAPNAHVEHSMGRVGQGPGGYREFAKLWLDAFPGAAWDVVGIRETGTGLFEVDLLATGTHTGTLVFGSWLFRPTSLDIRLPARELIQIKDGRLEFASLTFDLQELVRQLAPVDVAKLSQQLARIQQLGEQIAASASNPPRQRQLLDRLGAELDTARHVVRPYFR